MKLLIVLFMGVLVSGCSMGEVMETTYNMMMNVGKEQCEKETLSACSQQQSYYAYQRQRKEEIR